MQGLTSILSLFHNKFMVTTDTNNHNSCMTKHIFPNNFNIIYCIYLKLSGINGLDMPEVIILHLTICIYL